VLPPLRADGRFADPGQLFPGTVLIVVPHMDDEVLACGGTIASLPDPSRVHLVYASDGTRSSSPGLPWTDSSLSELRWVRRAEAKAALAKLGVPPDNLHFLDLPDGKLEHHRQALEQLLGELGGALQPDHVLIPFRYDRHPDHLAVNQAASSVLRHETGRIQLFEYFVYYRWRLLPRRDVRDYVRADQLHVVDIKPVAERKRSALECFKSQTSRYYPWQARPVLSQSSLDEVCRNPEVFLRHNPALAGADVFSEARNWIRFVHAVEPPAKRRKDRIMALIRRGTRWND
jgi:N-acetylglucosamine malate deacetylase 1